MVASTKSRLSDVLPQSGPPVERLARQTTLVPERPRPKSSSPSDEPARTPEQLRHDRWTAIWVLVVVAGMIGLIAWLAATSPHAAESANDLWMFY